LVLLVFVLLFFVGCTAVVLGSSSSPGSSPVGGSPASKEKVEAAKEMTQRELALLVKNPDSFKGKTIVLYAAITQFDSATGPCAFRANIAHANQEKSWDYDDNSVFTGGDGASDCPDLGGFVVDDEVRITATSLGSLSYDTQIGGRTTVPSFHVEEIVAAK
jgi:hypothetical protein